MSEFSSNKHRPLEIHRVKVHSSEIALISCEHDAEKMPKEDPWCAIDEEIAGSALTWVEYWPDEVDYNASKIPFGSHVVNKDYEKYGIKAMFSQVGRIAAIHGCEVAVSDLANSGSFEMNRMALQAASVGIPALLLSPNLYPDSAILSGVIGSYLGVTVSAMIHHNLVWKPEKWVCALKRLSGENNYLFDIEDARRIYSAKGIEQELARRKAGTKAVYVGPHAHVDRIRWNLEHPGDIATQVKASLYRLLPNLPFSTRIHKYSEKYESWNLVSNVPTRLK